MECCVLLRKRPERHGADGGSSPGCQLGGGPLVRRLGEGGAAGLCSCGLCARVLPIPDAPGRQPRGHRCGAVSPLRALRVELAADALCSSLVVGQ